MTKSDRSSHRLAGIRSPVKCLARGHLQISTFAHETREDIANLKMAADLAIEVSELFTSAEESELIVDAELRLLAEEEAVSASLILQELTGVHRHLETFAPSGIVDLSDRGLRAATRDLLDPAALGASVAAGITALDLSGNELSSVPTSLTKPMAGLLELDLSRNWLTKFPIAL